MSQQTDLPTLHPLVESHLEKIENLLKSGSKAQLCQLIIRVYRQYFRAQWKSPDDLPSEEQIAEFLKLFDPPKLALRRLRVIINQAPLDQCNDDEEGDTDPIWLFSIESRANRGFLLSIVSFVALFIAIPICLYAVVSVEYRRANAVPSAISAMLITTPFIAYGVSLVTSLTGIVQSLKVLEEVKQDGGRYAGYEHVVIGLLLACASCLSCLAMGFMMIIASNRS